MSLVDLPSDEFRCVTCDEEFMAQAEWLGHLKDRHENGHDADEGATEVTAEEAAS